MSRYIDADALIQELKRQYMFLFGTEEIPNGIGMLIENFPTADVVEVFRCKDCENWDYPYCCVLDDAFDGEFFCALGERRKH